MLKQQARNDSLARRQENRQVAVDDSTRDTGKDAEMQIPEDRARLLMRGCWDRSSGCPGRLKARVSRFHQGAQVRRDVGVGVVSSPSPSRSPTVVCANVGVRATPQSAAEAQRIARSQS